MKFTVWRTVDNRVYVEAEPIIDYFVVADFSQSGLIPQFERSVANDHARNVAKMIEWMLHLLDVEVFSAQHDNRFGAMPGAQCIAEFDIPESSEPDLEAA